MMESVSASPSSNPAPRPATSSDVEKRIRVALVEDDDGGETVGLGCNYS